jgi:hypothetical protein
MKRRVIQLISCSMLIALALFSCKKDKTPAVYLGYDYFPTNIGHWVIYNVDSMSYINLKWDTLTYQVKEVVDSKMGADTFRIARYKLDTATHNWVFQKYWKACLSATEALKDEDNTTFVKLIFPVKLGSTWNGGAFNAGVFWNDTAFTYNSVNTPATINSTYFDSTLTVLQYTDQYTNRLSNQYFVEQYATNVGLIYKQIIYLKASTTFIIGTDPANGMDSIWVPQDYIYLIKNNEIDQHSVLYTQTYVSSGN